MGKTRLDDNISPDEVVPLAQCLGGPHDFLVDNYDGFFAAAYLKATPLHTIVELSEKKGSIATQWEVEKSFDSWDGPQRTNQLLTEGFLVSS